MNKVLNKSWKELEQDIMAFGITKDEYELAIKETQDHWKGKIEGYNMSREAAISGVADLYGIDKTKEVIEMGEDTIDTEGEIQDKTMTDGKKKDGTTWERVAFKVAGHTYSSFDPKYKEFMKGEHVRIGFTKSGEYNTIVSVERITGKALKHGQSTLERTGNAQDSNSYWLGEANRKNRCVALNCAVSVYNALPEKDDTEWITTTAEAFAEWLSTGSTKDIKDINTDANVKISEENIK